MHECESERDVVFFSNVQCVHVYYTYSFISFVGLWDAKCDLLMRVIYVRCLDDILPVVQWRISAKIFSPQLISKDPNKTASIKANKTLSSSSRSLELSLVRSLAFSFFRSPFLSHSLARSLNQLKTKTKA